MKTFHVAAGIAIECDRAKTRSGFRHDATLIANGQVIRTKINYYNRTWEKYEYQSVLAKVLEKAREHITDAQHAEAVAYINRGPAEENPFAHAAFAAAIGSILCDTPKDANDWKVRMLKAGVPAIDLPADWDQLPEAEKQRRLDAAISTLRAP